MTSRPLRIGQIVPSSNVTMETEIPEIMRRHAEHTGDVSFTFHSSRMRMKTVAKDELAAMDAQSDRCALELSDAAVDVVGYACLSAAIATTWQMLRELDGPTVAPGCGSLLNGND